MDSKTSRTLVIRLSSCCKKESYNKFNILVTKEFGVLWLRKWHNQVFTKIFFYKPFLIIPIFSGIQPLLRCEHRSVRPDTSPPSKRRWRKHFRHSREQTGVRRLVRGLPAQQVRRKPVQSIQPRVPEGISECSRQNVCFQIDCTFRCVFCLIARWRLARL